MSGGDGRVFVLRVACFFFQTKKRDRERRKTSRFDSTLLTLCDSPQSVHVNLLVVFACWTWYVLHEAQRTAAKACGMTKQGIRTEKRRASNKWIFFSSSHNKNANTFFSWPAASSSTGADK